ncbi:hypothetical protein C8R45DRAFT_998096 [Mycena sanguinolenta]|nr:hypothetical protein C8R45DRAFT_998096 [Mycena sanguinolenta]
MQPPSPTLVLLHSAAASNNSFSMFRPPTLAMRLIGRRSLATLWRLKRTVLSSNARCKLNENDELLWRCLTLGSQRASTLRRTFDLDDYKVVFSWPPMASCYLPALDTKNHSRSSSTNTCCCQLRPFSRRHPMMVFRIRAQFSSSVDVAEE